MYPIAHLCEKALVCALLLMEPWGECMTEAQLCGVGFLKGYVAAMRGSIPGKMTL
jgi:hypothetical protein